MKLKVGLIGVIGLIHVLVGYYYSREISLEGKHGGKIQNIDCSLLEIFKKKSKRRERSSSSIEESDSDLDSKGASSSQRKVKKNKSGCGKKGSCLPRIFRRIFKRKNKKIKSRRNAIRRKNRFDDDSSSDEESEKRSSTSATRASVEPEPSARTELKPSSGIGPDTKPSEPEPRGASSRGATASGDDSSGSGSVSKLSKGIERLGISGDRISGSDKESHFSDLKSRLSSRLSSQDTVLSSILEGDSSGKNKLVEMPLENFYSYLDGHISSNTSGNTLLLNLKSLLQSIQISKLLSESMSAEPNIELAIRQAFKQAEIKYGPHKKSLLNLFRDKYGEECSIEHLNELIQTHHNVYMEFKLAEEIYQGHLDPKRGNASDRARNISQSYYEMKSANSKVRQIITKYVDCHMLIFHYNRIDEITTGTKEEKCEVHDLVILKHYQSIALALKKLNHYSFNEKKEEVLEYENILVSGKDESSMTEEDRIRYKILGRLSSKLLLLHSNAILFETIVEAIDLKLSHCLSYIIWTQMSSAPGYSVRL